MPFASDIDYIIGIDEVGRGPIAGPVTVCAALCPRNRLAKVMVQLSDVRDSKQLSAKRRQDLSDQLHDHEALVFAVASVTAEVIDRIGISSAIKKALAKTLQQLGVDPARTHVLLDGRLKAPPKYKHQATIVRGDQTEWLIGAASIVAKVHRDAKMVRYAKKYPKYKFDQHKGYGTQLHYDMLRKHKATPIHRMSFLPDGLKRRRQKKR